MQVVHQASQTVKENIGSDCPVFQQTCPFKNCATTSGTPLLLELDTRSWGLMIPEAESHIAEETSLAPPKVSAELGLDADEEIDVGLAKKLKEGTAEAHKAAETVHFVREFIKGRVTREVYRQMVVNLYHVYAALEEALDKCWEHPLVEPLYFPDELRRTTTLRADAEFYWGPDWENHTQASPVTVEYVARLREIAATSPELIVPHAYTRYLGDLSGGQVLKRAAIRGLKLPKETGEGVQFYMFKRIPDAKAFKNMYRARLDALQADREVADTMVIEANYAFAMNTRMFQELDKLAGFEGDAQALASAQAVQPAGAKATPSSLPDPSVCPFASLAAAGFAMPADHPPMEDTKKSVNAGVKRRKQTVDKEVTMSHTQVVIRRSGKKLNAVLAHIFLISVFVLFAWLLSR
jgi:heme oxygenase